MRIFDMHVHAKGTAVDKERFLSELSEAGIYGACIFSSAPIENKLPWSRSFEERLSEVLGWREEGRLFPVLWIHPREENIIEKLRLAKASGVLGIKMICNDYFVYEDDVKAVIYEIARLGLPIFFHSGILWDGEVSSAYNRPLNWETLLDVDGLRFSMGHCSWPWIDECIALYGKFLNSNRGSEMFFDITPGTPKIYRDELLTKLYTIGYDVGDNIMFGTDCSSDEYRSEWAKDWLTTDKKTLDRLGVSLQKREKLYEKNLFRFLGISGEKSEHTRPVTDGAQGWSAVNEETKTIIEKWYKRLGFPKHFDAEFKKALSEIPVSDATAIEDYDLSSEDGRRNLLSFLFMCERVEKEYKKRDIPEDILLETLSDIVVWTGEWSAVKGSLYLGELQWLKRHLSLEIFRLGRLQFSLSPSEFDIPAYGVKKGDRVLEVHIPKAGRLDPDECDASFKRSREFFDKYFPEKPYALLSCHSWLLDEGLCEYLPEGSNILTFGNRFKRQHSDESLAIIQYTFRWDTRISNLAYAYPTSEFARKIQRAALSGKPFYETLGVIEK